jgi:hypothetical protein
MSGEVKDGKNDCAIKTKFSFTPNFLLNIKCVY